MGKYTTNTIRNIALVGHKASGKTTLCEAMLYKAGVTNRLASSTMDFSPDEKERQHSIDSAIAHLSWKDKEINIIDLPGYQEFIHNVISALPIVETAVIVISVIDGIGITTRKAWEIAEEKGMPRIIVVTKLDTENVSFEKALEQIHEHFGAKCIPLTIPDAVGPSFSKVINTFELPSDLPPALSEEAKKFHEKMIESIVELDDELMMKYLDGEKIASDILVGNFFKGIMHGRIIPILVASPAKEIGVTELLDTITLYTPSPVDVGAKKGKKVGSEEELVREPLETAPFSGQVFKVYNDRYGRLTYFRVFSGTISSGTTLYNSRGGKPERIGSLTRPLGKEETNVEKAIPGDIVTVAKVENPCIGDTVCDDKNPIEYPRQKYPTPMMSLAVEPKSRGDEQRISSALNKLSEEDFTFKVIRDEETAELVISGMSDLHLKLMLGRLKTRGDVDCLTKTPRIPYRETISGKSDSRYRHKKQTGGHGQFGEVAIKLEPTGRGEGFDFVNQIVGGVVPSQFVASTEKGVKGAMSRGVIAGYPVVDVRVMLYDGKTHEVDSSDAAFQIAGSKAFQEGFMNARPVLLEPIVNMEIIVPTQYMGDIMGDLNSRRGRIMGSEAKGMYQTIKALAPLAEVQSYSTELKSTTGGEGTYSIEFSHYDIVPSYVQDKIIARAKAEKEEKENKK